MKTFIALLFSIISITLTINAQQQILNPGFEQWEDVSVGTDEPVHWSSIKTSDNLVLNGLAPVVWGPSSDAHTGNFSLSLVNIGTLGIVATGTISTGRLHADLDPDLGYAFTDPDDARWHSVFTDRPDSIAGWFKCNPMTGDFGTVKFLLHTGYAQIPGDESNYVAVAYYELPGEHITQWTRFSAPFVYTSGNNPEYCLSIITSGNGTQAVDGSTALFDDIEFIYNESSVDELPQNQLKVFVSNKQLNLNVNGTGHEIYNLRLLDINGRITIEAQIESGENNIIDISSLPIGIYIAVASNSQKTFTQKVFIK